MLDVIHRLISDLDHRVEPPNFRAASLHRHQSPLTRSSHRLTGIGPLEAPLVLLPLDLYHLLAFRKSLLSLTLMCKKVAPTSTEGTSQALMRTVVDAMSCVSGKAQETHCTHATQAILMSSVYVMLLPSQGILDLEALIRTAMARQRLLKSTMACNPQPIVEPHPRIPRNLSVLCHH